MVILRNLALRAMAALLLCAGLLGLGPAARAEGSIFYASDGVNLYTLDTVAPFSGQATLVAQFPFRITALTYDRQNGFFYVLTPDFPSDYSLLYRIDRRIPPQEWPFVGVYLIGRVPAQVGGGSGGFAYDHIEGVLYAGSLDFAPGFQWGQPIQVQSLLYRIDPRTAETILIGPTGSTENLVIESLAVDSRGVLYGVSWVNYSAPDDEHRYPAVRAYPYVQVLSKDGHAADSFPAFPFPFGVIAFDSDNRMHILRPNGVESNGRFIWGDGFYLERPNSDGSQWSYTGFSGITVLPYLVIVAAPDTQPETP